MTIHVPPPSSSSSSLSTKTTSSSTIQYSLWLLPPDGGPFQSHMRRQIEHYSQTVPGASVAFEPHVTVVGGFTCMNDDAVDKVVQILHQGLNGFGRIRMSLQPDEQYNDNCCFQVKGHANLAWSQALYLPMQASDEFVALCRLARKLLQQLPSPTKTTRTILDVDDDKEHLFAPPADEPHVSLCYAHHVHDTAFCEARASLQGMMTSSVGDNNTPFSFWAESLALYQTDPASVEGVAQWRELAVIDLVCNSRPSCEQGKVTATAATTSTTTSQ